MGPGTSTHRRCDRAVARDGQVDARHLLTDFQDDGRLVAATVEALAGEDVLVVATTAAVDPATITPSDNARVERFLPHGPVIGERPAWSATAARG